MRPGVVYGFAHSGISGQMQSWGNNLALGLEAGRVVGLRRRWTQMGPDGRRGGLDRINRPPYGGLKIDRKRQRPHGQGCAEAGLVR